IEADSSRDGQMASNGLNRDTSNFLGMFCHKDQCKTFWKAKIDVAESPISPLSNN
ncbi:hypothetical protein HAX54_010021, partial [Datura stramonium]|nr:hypothetical protein [Datura stramonium]